MSEDASSEQAQSGGIPPHSQPPVRPAPGWVPPPYGPPPGQQPPAGYWPAQPVPQQWGYPVPQQNQYALVALILSIVSLALSCFGIVTAVVALVLASKAKKEIDASNGWQTGSGMVTAARWVSWVFIGLFALMLVFFAIMMIVSAVAGGFDTPQHRY